MNCQDEKRTIDPCGFWPESTLDKVADAIKNVESKEYTGFLANGGMGYIKPHEPEFKPRLNIYSCADGHDTVTIDKDHGTTPMFMDCKTCGKQATSHWYNVPKGLIPTWEWYKPNISDVNDYEMDHVLSGGLLLRPISNLPPVPAISDKIMADMQRFHAAWKRSNPNATQRQFKRAFAKKFPNQVDLK